MSLISFEPQIVLSLEVSRKFEIKSLHVINIIQNENDVIRPVEHNFIVIVIVGGKVTSIQ
jgi:hypothetical protein